MSGSSVTRSLAIACQRLGPLVPPPPAPAPQPHWPPEAAAPHAKGSSAAPASLLAGDGVLLWPGQGTKRSEGHGETSRTLLAPKQRQKRNGHPGGAPAPAAKKKGENRCRWFCPYCRLLAGGQKAALKVALSGRIKCSLIF